MQRSRQNVRRTREGCILNISSMQVGAMLAALFISFYLNLEEKRFLGVYVCVHRWTEEGGMETIGKRRKRRHRDKNVFLSAG